MERKLQKLEHCQTEVEVTFSKEEWDGAKKKAFDKLKGEVQIKGFRKGKAPDNLVREHIDQNKLLDNAINDLLPDAYRAIVVEDKVEPYAQPQVDVKELTEDKLVVKFLIATAPEVELGQYKGLKLGKEEVTVSDEELNGEINKLLEDNATLVTKDGEAANGDTVVIDFDGFVDGEAFEGGSSTNYELVLGSHYFIPGFEEQVVGHKSGDEFDVNVTFPEQYVENLKGKAAVFKVKLHEIKAKILPELNDETVKELGIEGVETVDALKAKKKAELEKNKTENARRTYVNKLIAKIVENSKIEIPDAIINQEVDNKKKDFEQRMAQSGFTLEQYLQVVGQKEEDYLANLRKDAEGGIRHVLILQEVAKLEKFGVSDEELEAEFDKLAAQYGMSKDDVKKALASQLEQFKHQLVVNKADEFLFTNND